MRTPCPPRYQSTAGNTADSGLAWTLSSTLTSAFPGTPQTRTAISDRHRLCAMVAKATSESCTTLVHGNSPSSPSTALRDRAAQLSHEADVLGHRFVWSCGPPDVGP